MIAWNHLFLITSSRFQAALAQSPWQGQVENQSPGVFQLSMRIPTPTYNPFQHDLSKEMARKLHAAACQGQVGKAWKQTRSAAPRHPQRSHLRSGRKRTKNSNPTVPLPCLVRMPRVGTQLLNSEPPSSMSSRTTRPQMLEDGPLKAPKLPSFFLTYHLCGEHDSLTWYRPSWD